MGSLTFGKGEITQKNNARVGPRSQSPLGSQSLNENYFQLYKSVVLNLPNAVTFKTVHVLLTPNHKIIFVAIVMNHNVNICVFQWS